MSRYDLFFAGGFALLNGAAFLAFAFDKWRAGRAASRIAERHLVLLGALGGWLGGLMAMSIFRHKTAKATFKLKYTLALIPFAAEIWAWWHWR